MLNTDANVKFLSNTFAAMLKDEMSADDFEKMKELNKAEPDRQICHSHDFIDANAVMLTAFERCFPEIKFDLDNDSYIGLFNAAWSLAKGSGQI